MESSAAPEHGLLMRFAIEYTRYHGYISVVVCVLGIVCSLLVIAVLTRRHMLTSSNYMLTALAICDLVTMISYIPYAILFYCLYRDPNLSTGAYVLYSGVLEFVASFKAFLDSAVASKGPNSDLYLVLLHVPFHNFLYALLEFPLSVLDLSLSVRLS